LATWDFDVVADRRLIVNADDLGQSAGINGGILAAHDEGIVTSASLMVRWPAATEAAAAAQSRPRLSVGLHVDLGEWKFQHGDWRPVYEVVLLNDTSATMAEISRQLGEFCRLMGRQPTHLDSHQHVHRNEPVRSALTAMAQELRVPLRHFCPHVQYCGAFYGQDEEGTSQPAAITYGRLIEILSSLSPGTTELACHPGFADDLDTMYRGERQMELSALCDPGVKQAVRSLGIELCSFFDVAGTPV
jgi:predicted glycoside hydrolase/deacetylase ChbG (UPF0249 family)